MTARRLLRKTVASLLKRYHILVHDGYSVGTAYGARFLFDWRHSLDKKVALELYEQEQISYLIEQLEEIKPEMFMDIGSHAALYSIILKTHFPSLEVHAFEPDRTNLCQLKANLFINRLQNDISVHEYGLSDNIGNVSFDTSEETSTRGTRRITDSGNIEIAVKRLDDLFETKNRTVAMKIDVEGHECQVAEGAKVFLANNRCFLQIESTGSNVAILKKKLDDLDYKLVNFIPPYDHFFTNIDLP